MAKGKLYVVTMYRFGDRTNHSYVLGVFNKKDAAVKRGDEESNFRGGKYMPECLELEPGITDERSFTRIIPLTPKQSMRSS